ncbi:membrane-spanning 4-domains subfamily A member 8-like isoform X1 [Myotis daubentonii]|uniref:membrane-spanning 4-domains subfamily A member 8-like isoform X1 n=1 Tax=Myotis daubentonii TaxID=98922 RepID=UPI0028736DB1|nr:membrane-spanning 4-domains subfamily A member 8-like isoform X1 [Myotis daubentonii]XP_059565198.1 membrane-spanning 4-domains subfamily A member 8-like isoform X1 [Myotis daubentonii]
MNSMTSAGPQANTVFVMAPHNGYPVIPGSMSQVPQYPLTQPQIHTISGNLHGLEPPVYTQPDQRSFKAGKVLGAIQILIGLIHIGLGIILGTIIPGRYTAISFYGGYPFWGGILVSTFIISGSLSVASEHLPRSSCLLNGSLALNIISAICSMVGISLFITELIINPLHYYYPNYLYWGVSPGVATSAVLFIFSLLEFCIACMSAHDGNQLLRHSHNSGPIVFQTIYTNPEPLNSPPGYNVVQGSR